MRRQGTFVVPITLAKHGVEHAHVIDYPTQSGEQITGGDASLAPLLKLETRLDEVAIELAWLVEPATGGDSLPMTGLQHRLGIESIDLGHAASGIQKNHPIGLGRKMPGPACEWVISPGLVGQQARQGQGPEAAGSLPEPLPA